MIYSITGRFVGKGEHFMVVEVSGVGLKVFTHERALERLPHVGEEVKMFCHLHLREDALELYGFLDAEELQFFEQLISVSGVGPKSALAILDIATLRDLTAAVQSGRPDLLTRASGIGRKTAERIVLELRGKVRAEQPEEAVKKMESDADLVETLAELGYRREEAKEALARVGETTEELEARLKEALKILSGKKTL